jgi:hypothetical protein
MKIQRKGSKDKPISESQQRNHRIAKTRVRIEHVFAGSAQMGGKTVHPIGLAPAMLHLNWKVAVYNLQRLVYLRRRPRSRHFDARGPSGRLRTSSTT